ncbi:MAG TPA: phosphatase PAP2 family protein [Vicinamibacterales bacterium]|nr:phosphatase PAP2 family protein [Vicinamibacterales bacterium]
MAPWGWIAGGYGLLLTITGFRLRGVARRPVVIVACASFALVAAGAATLSSFWVHLFAPGAFLLGGYWLSGLLFTAPQQALEDRLLQSDRQLFDRLRLDRLLERAPRWMLEALEAVYTSDYLVVGAGAIIAATHGAAAIVRYWTIVLAAELACYAALPFLRSRPPRSLEPRVTLALRGLVMRRFNATILDRASVQANTIPSGHVAGALAAALAVLPLNPAAGSVFLVLSLLIAVSATVGRYHYAVDCVLGAFVAVVVVAVSWAA